MKKAMISVLSSVISILVGLLFGLILLIAVNPGQAFPKFAEMLTAGFSTAPKMAKVLYQAAPLIMTGLSVAFAFKTGLFNIGASGQYTVGAFCALACGIIFPLGLLVYMRIWRYRLRLRLDLRNIERINNLIAERIIKTHPEIATPRDNDISK